jgi:hypothetical protein
MPHGGAAGPDLVFALRVIFSENRFPPRIKSGAGFFGITRQADIDQRLPNRRDLSGQVPDTK